MLQTQKNIQTLISDLTEIIHAVLLCIGTTINEPQQCSSLYARPEKSNSKPKAQPSYVLAIIVALGLGLKARVIVVDIFCNYITKGVNT